MTDLDTGPSSIRDDSICESSLPPNKSSGDIGEDASWLMLVRDVKQFEEKSVGSIRIDMNDVKSILRAAAEIERRDRIISAHQQQIIDGSAMLAAKDAEIERLMRELADAKFVLTDPTAFHLHALRNNVLSRMNALHIAGATDYDSLKSRALTAESAVADAMEALKPFEEAYEAVCYDDGVPDDFNIWESPAAMSITVGDLRRASAIHAAVEKKTAESGHSPSTHNSESE